MAITQTPDSRWQFTLGRQTFGGYATRDDAATALYDLERGILPATIHTDPNEDAILDWILNVADMAPEERIIRATEHILKGQQPGDLVKATLEYVSQPVADEIIDILNDPWEDIIAAFDQPKKLPVTYQRKHLPDGSGDGWDEYSCAGVDIAFQEDYPPLLYLPGRNGLPLSFVARCLPAINALMADPRVRAALGLA